MPRRRSHAGGETRKGRRRGLVEGPRVSATIAGDRRRVQVADALVAPVSRTSIVSPDVAAKVASKLGPRSCTDAGVLGQVCGRTVGVEVAVSKCARVISTEAVVAEMPSGLRLVVGEDVLKKAVSEIEFRKNWTRLRCR